jgi:glycyl-tRNA synthetase beta subunit
MSKYSLVKLMENEEDGGSSSKLKATYNLVLTPKGTTIDKVESALTNPSFLGIYMSNLRNRFQKQYEEKFGTVYDRRSGKKPPVTKDMENEFYSSLLKDKKTRLLTWTTKGDSLVFPQKNNPSKDLTKKIIKTILGNAKIKYDIAEKEL